MAEWVRRKGWATRHPWEFVADIDVLRALMFLRDTGGQGFSGLVHVHLVDVDFDGTEIRDAQAELLGLADEEWETDDWEKFEPPQDW